MYASASSVRQPSPNVEAFPEIFSQLDYWGPESPQTTEQALAALPFKPERILEIGCGNGVATLVLDRAGRHAAVHHIVTHISAPHDPLRRVAQDQILYSCVPVSSAGPGLENLRLWAELTLWPDHSESRLRGSSKVL